MPFTPLKGYSVQAAASNPGVWGDGNPGSDLNSGVMGIMDANMGGVVSKSLSASPVTLTSTEAQNLVLRMTGTLLAGVTITTPGIGFYFIDNQTTGNFSVTIQYTGGVGGTVVAQQTVVTLVVIDATNGVRAEGQYPNLVALNNITATSGIIKKTGATTWAATGGVTDLAATTANRLFGTNGSGTSGLVTTDASLAVASSTLAVVAATKAQMESQAATAPTYPSVQAQHPAHPKAWVNFDGTTTPATIKQAYNVSAVSHDSTGRYTVSFTVPFANTTYGTMGTARPPSSYDGILSLPFGGTKTVGAVQIITCFANASLFDAPEVSVAFFGTQ